MNNRLIVIGSLVFIGVLTGSYFLIFQERGKTSSSHDVAAAISDMETERIIRTKEWLIGRKLQSIETIVGDSLIVIDRGLLVFIFSDMDCQNCVNDGLNLVQQIEQEVGDRSVCVIEATVSSEQSPYIAQYGQPVHIDQVDIVRKELKYFYTPVLLSLDKDRRVRDAYYPDRGDHVHLWEEFLLNLATLTSKEGADDH